jgi:hypothetical protein
MVGGPSFYLLSTFALLAAFNGRAFGLWRFAPVFPFLPPVFVVTLDGQ